MQIESMKKYYIKTIQWFLSHFARKVILTHNPFVIAVTGSVGKTSTKEAIYQVLHDQFGEEVRKNHGNFNNELGLSLAILGYGHDKNKQPSPLGWIPFLFKAYLTTFEKKYPKYLILEMGVDNPGDIAYFESLVQPDIAVITSVSGAHLANFKNLKAYQDEKISIIKGLKNGGKVVVNFDEKELQNLPFDQLFSYSLNNSKANFFTQDIKYSLSGTEYRICSSGQKIAIKSKLLGFQSIYSSLAAFAVGHALGFQSLEIKKSLEKIEPVSGRMKLIKGKKNITIIDDTYNANPSSVKAALQVLSGLDYDGRKVAVLGNMNELGQFEIGAHSDVADFAKDKADLVIFAGPNAEKQAEIVGGKKSLAYKNRIELEKKLDDVIKPGDLVLIKASQNKNFFEEITKKIMLEPEKASEILVRQSKRWSKIKRKNSK